MRDVIKQFILTSKNAGFYHVVNCYLEGGTVFRFSNTLNIKGKDKIKTAIIIMCLNLPSCEVKNQLTFYKVRWLKYIF